MSRRNGRNGVSQGLYGLFPNDLIMVNRVQQLTQQFSSLVNNLTSLDKPSRQRGNALDPRRNIDDECGYPAAITAQEYKHEYNRNEVAARIVSLMSSYCWQVSPTIFESEDEDTVTPFEMAIDDLGQSLRDEESFYQDEEGSPLWDILARADELSGIGHYGVLLFGFDDGKPLNEPVRPKEGMKLLFVRPFDESMAQIARRVNDVSDRRYGKPEAYNVKFSDDETDQEIGISGGARDSLTTSEVHWTRCLHVVIDGLASSDLAAIPRMKQPFNRLMDLAKVYGSSAEGYWRNGMAGRSWETHPQLGGDVDIDIQNLKDQLEQFNNGLQRDMVTTGLSAKVLSPAVSDPTTQINVLLEAICIGMECPIRIFKGSERGELASSQDERDWRKKYIRRRVRKLTPRLIIPFIDRLINLKVLPQPKGYSVYWPETEDMTETEKANVANLKTTAITAFVGGNGEAMMQPMDFYTRVMGYTTEEAESIVEGAVEHLEEANPDTEDEIVAGHIPSAPPEEAPPAPVSPIKVKEGEKLVNPEDGSPLGG